MPRSSTPTRALQITLDLEAHAARELADYFARRRDVRRRGDWREIVEAVLATLPAYHRGVLSLYHAARVWPDGIQKAFGSYSSLAIRLDCSDHPATGSTPALEAAAAERLAAILAKEGESGTVLGLQIRAEDLFESAVRAYAKARRQHTQPGCAETAEAAE